MLYAAALKAGKRTPAEIRDYYRAVKNFEGASGPVTFDNDGITMEVPVMRIVRDGKPVVLK